MPVGIISMNFEMGGKDDNIKYKTHELFKKCV